ncbi:unnamed protein product [Porites lobata]|uniref:Uncharacterized protein n=1 Tax=Porites lobata TaxID=104759 RepID=A0ABN8P544_9CNID|nr:unnamed protein product [Porites lobata]
MKYEDAAETAFAQKSKEGLDLVLGNCSNSNRPLVNRIQEMKAQLRQSRKALLECILSKFRLIKRTL